MVPARLPFSAPARAAYTGPAAAKPSTMLSLLDGGDDGSAPANDFITARDAMVCVYVCVRICACALGCLGAANA